MLKWTDSDYQSISLNVTSLAHRCVHGNMHFEMLECMFAHLDILSFKKRRNCMDLGTFGLM